MGPVQATTRSLCADEIGTGSSHVPRGHVGDNGDGEDGLGVEGIPVGEEVAKLVAGRFGGVGCMLDIKFNALDIGGVASATGGAGRRWRRRGSAARSRRIMDLDGGNNNVGIGDDAETSDVDEDEADKVGAKV